MKQLLRRIFLFKSANKDTKDIPDDLFPAELQKMMHVIGRNNALKIWEMFSGRQIYFPRYQNSDYNDRNKEIVKRYHSGDRVEDIAKEYKITPRRLYQIINE